VTPLCSSDYSVPSLNSEGGTSSHLDAFNSWRGFMPAQNQTCQDASDRIKLNGIDERVGADVEKSQKQRRIVGVILKIRTATQAQKQDEESFRQPCHGVECTDENHGLDHVGLNLM